MDVPIWCSSTVEHLIDMEFLREPCG